MGHPDAGVRWAGGAGRPGEAGQAQLPATGGQVGQESGPHQQFCQQAGDDAGAVAVVPDDVRQWVCQAHQRLPRLVGSHRHAHTLQVQLLNCPGLVDSF